MPTGITTVVGRAPIPFAGYGDFGVARQWSRSRRSDRSRFAGFAGSSELVSIAHQALSRLQNAIDSANEACESQSGYLDQTIFNWITGNTSTASICGAASTMQAAYDTYRQKVDDPNTTDDQIAEIIGYINKNTDIHDLLDLAESTNVLTVTGRALLHAPGTAVGLVAEGAERVVGPVLGAIPWWAWAAGAVFLATQLGWNPLKKGT
jgi:hypothetical protein